MLTIASQTCVVRPPWSSTAVQAMLPMRTVSRKFVLSSMAEKLNTEQFDERAGATQSELIKRELTHQTLSPRQQPATPSRIVHIMPRSGVLFRESG